MLLFRVYAFAVIAAGLCLATQPAAAAPIPTVGPDQGASQLLHLVHGGHGACILGHRHRSDGLPVPCALEDQDDDGDDDDGGDGDDYGDDGEGEGTCIQIGPVGYCE